MGPQRYQPVSCASARKSPLLNLLNFLLQVSQHDDTLMLESIDSAHSRYDVPLPSPCPGSPPPSFHSSQSMDDDMSPQTPQLTSNGDEDANGVAISSSNDAALAIALLRSRVDMLEESIGRLLVGMPRLPSFLLSIMLFCPPLSLILAHQTQNSRGLHTNIFSIFVCCGYRQHQSIFLFLLSFLMSRVYCVEPSELTSSAARERNLV